MKKLDPISVLDSAPDLSGIQELQATLASLETAVGRAAAAMVADEKEALTESLHEGRVRPVELTLALAKDSYAWSLSRNTLPAYYEWKSAVARLRQAGIQLKDYAGILGRLADAKSLSPAETAALEKKLDTLLQSGMAAGGALDSQASRKAAAGLVSLAAGDLFRLVLKRRRGTTLQQAVAANDEAFRSYVQSLRTLLRMFHVSLRLHYVDTAGDLLAAWTPADALVKKTKGKRRIPSATAAKRLLSLNDTTIERLGALAAIETVLDSLPAAHARCLGEG